MPCRFCLTVQIDIIDKHITVPSIFGKIINDDVEKIYMYTEVLYFNQHYNVQKIFQINAKPLSVIVKGYVYTSTASQPFSSLYTVWSSQRLTGFSSSHSSTMSLCFVHTSTKLFPLLSYRWLTYVMEEEY